MSSLASVRILASSASARPRSLPLLALAVVLAWTGFALLSVTHFYLGKAAADVDVSFVDLAGHILLFYWGWALLTPLVLAVARDLAARTRLEARDVAIGWTRAIAAAPVIMLLHAGWYLSAVRIAGVDPLVTLSVAQLRDYGMRHGGGDLATYAAIVGAVLLLDARRRAREREAAAAALESRLARADAELLRWQLQPHFLFNTLNTVSTLVLKGEAEAADRAINLIARWLRDALSQRSDAVVTLDEELATVRQYVAIEVLRFGDVLRLDVQADSEALAARVPGLIVQPLVENAIRHGFTSTDHTTPVTISARVRDRRVRVSVRNRDVTTRGAFINTPATVRSDADGFGLRYVRERLAHFYGEDAHLELIADGLDVVASLDLPLIVDADAHPSPARRAIPAA